MMGCAPRCLPLCCDSEPPEVKFADVTNVALPSTTMHFAWSGARLPVSLDSLRIRRSAPLRTHGRTTRGRRRPCRVSPIGCFPVLSTPPPPDPLLPDLSHALPLWPRERMRCSPNPHLSSPAFEVRRGSRSCGAGRVISQRNEFFSIYGEVHRRIRREERLRFD
jgi:hypothetical protein